MGLSVLSGEILMFVWGYGVACMWECGNVSFWLWRETEPRVRVTGGVGPGARRLGVKRFTRERQLTFWKIRVYVLIILGNEQVLVTTHWHYPPDRAPHV